MRTIVTVCVVTIFLLVPVQCFKLPLNLSLVDVWAALALPVCWIHVAQSRLRVRFAYLPAILLMLLATGVAALAAPVSFADSLVAALTEVYLYALLLTLAALFEHADPKNYERLLTGWLVAVLANGAVVFLQFAHPPLSATMNDLLGGMGMVDRWRPSGLFSNCNAAATFQVTGLVPLFALRWPARRAWSFGAVLFIMVFATGSMGAFLALLLGSAASVIAFALILRSWEATVRIAMATAILTASVIAVFVFLMIQLPEFREQIEYMTYGRVDRSSSGRFDLWTGGIELMLSEGPTWGIGAGGYQRVIGQEAHNDVIGITVERGLLGTLSLILFAVLAMRRSIELIRLGRTLQDRSVIVFPGCLVAIAFNSLTHEVFHLREIWMVLALQEGVLWRMRARSAG